MSGTTWFLLTVAVNAGAFAAGLSLCRRCRRAATGFFALAVFTLLAKGILNWRPDWEFALFPFPDYLYVQSWLGYPIGLFTMGLGVGLLPRFPDRRALAVLAAFVFCLSLWSERWMLMPAGHESDRVADPDHHCMQSTGWSCAAAACVTLLSYLEVEATEGEMIELCRTQPASGTSIFRICRGLRLKLPAQEYDIRIVNGDPASLRELGLPAIVTENLAHVVTVSFSGDSVTVHDPAWPVAREMTFEEYQEVYGGYAVVVSPANSDQKGPAR
jgi:Peptidase C39 family